MVTLKYTETQTFKIGVILIFFGRMVMAFFLDKNPLNNEYLVLFLVAVLNGQGALLITLSSL